MRITRNQLRRIINEELSLLLKEEDANEEDVQQSFEEFLKDKTPQVRSELMAVDRELAELGWEKEMRRFELFQLVGYGAGLAPWGYVLGDMAANPIPDLPGSWEERLAQTADIRAKHGWTEGSKPPTGFDEDAYTQDLRAFNIAASGGENWATRNPDLAPVVGAGLGIATGVLTAAVVNRLARRAGSGEAERARKERRGKRRERRGDLGS